MTTNIKPSRYIIYNETAIWGIGRDEGEAWKDAGEATGAY